MIKSPDLESMSAEERKAWHEGYVFARVDTQKLLDKKDEAIKQILFLQHKEMQRWRDAGITYDAVRDILNKHEREEISFGKLVEELRGLASAALEKFTDV
jgi:hypothetical protein